MTTSKQKDGVINLNGGRKLGYKNYGDVNGTAVLFFHGLPGSRLEAQKLHLAAVNTKVHLIGIDRPGMGLSSPDNERTLLHWADDIKALAIALNLTKFSVLGHSGGAPYVAACAYRIPELLNKAVIVSGMAPLANAKARASLSFSQKQMYWMTRYFPLLLKLMMKLSFKALENPNQLKKMLKQLPDIDAKIFEDAHHRDAMVLALKEAFRQNAKGVVTDFKLLLQPLEFELEDIQCPVVIWQGGKDKQAPQAHAEIYHRAIAHSEYNFLPDEGHLSMLHSHGEQLLLSAV